ncbi:MAG: hypothetical protein LUQ68_04800 [Methylococcaceae bacterium]|nr:hypothetical protein [Methylococcaceae bacterium]OYV22722.1 MAG: hypothetical protein CG442_910 [Methylococcaceae bacterium NSO1]
MTTQLEVLLDKLKALEIEVIDELQKQEEEFSYEIRKRRVIFEENVIIRHKEYAKQLIKYITDAPLKHIFSAPFVWICIIPSILMDMTISLYQTVCFPIYGIPKVKRQDYIVFDRQYLQYLNLIEKFNCAYCSYANGLLAYLQEIAARTEQFWCPIKHAKRIKTLHSRYQKFFSYGDAQKYRSQVDSVRHDFKDLE